MKRFVLRFVIFATLLVLILPVGSLAAAIRPGQSLRGTRAPRNECTCR